MLGIGKGDPQATAPAKASVSQGTAMRRSSRNAAHEATERTATQAEGEADNPRNRAPKRKVTIRIW